MLGDDSGSDSRTPPRWDQIDHDIKAIEPDENELTQTESDAPPRGDQMEHEPMAGVYARESGHNENNQATKPSPTKRAAPGDEAQGGEDTDELKIESGGDFDGYVSGHISGVDGNCDVQSIQRQLDEIIGMQVRWRVPRDKDGNRLKPVLIGHPKTYVERPAYVEDRDDRINKCALDIAVTTPDRRRITYVEADDEDDEDSDDEDEIVEPVLAQPKPKKKNKKKKQRRRHGNRKIRKKGNRRY